MDKETLAKFEKFIGRKITVQEAYELYTHEWMYGTCAMDKDGNIVNPMEIIIHKKI